MIVSSYIAASYPITPSPLQRAPASYLIQETDSAAARTTRSEAEPLYWYKGPFN